MNDRKPKKVRNRKDNRNDTTDTACPASRGTVDAEQTINALKRKAEEIRQAQLNLTLRKLHSLTDEEKNSLELMTREMVQGLLDAPIRRMENGVENGKNYTLLVRQLFHLDDEQPR